MNNSVKPPTRGFWGTIKKAFHADAWMSASPSGRPDQQQPNTGGDPYNQVKEWYLTNLLAAKLVNLPIDIALSEPRQFKCAKAPAEALEEYVRMYNGMDITDLIIQLARNMRLYGLASIVKGYVDPISANPDIAGNVFFNVLDPLVGQPTAVSSDPLSKDYQRVVSLQVNGSVLRADRFRAVQNEGAMAYVFTNSAFAYAGRSVLQRAGKTIIAYDQLLDKYPQIIHKIAAFIFTKSSGSPTTQNEDNIAVMRKNNEAIEQVARGAISIPAGATIDTFRMEQSAAVLKNMRDQILEDAAIAAGLPASLVLNQKFATSLGGEGQADFKLAMKFMESFRKKFDAVNEWVEPLIARMAWSDQFIDELRHNGKLLDDEDAQKTNSTLRTEWINTLIGEYEPLVPVSKYDDIDNESKFVKLLLEVVKVTGDTEWLLDSLNDSGVFDNDVLEFDILKVAVLNKINSQQSSDIDGTDPQPASLGENVGEMV